MQPAEVSLKQSGKIIAKTENIKEEDIVNVTSREMWNLQFDYRKAAHMIEYSGLGLLSLLALRYLKRK
jgi:hypothetical protein